jgi:hypothetical protein
MYGCWRPNRPDDDTQQAYLTNVIVSHMFVKTKFLDISMHFNGPLKTTLGPNSDLTWVESNLDRAAILIDYC